MTTPRLDPWSGPSEWGRVYHLLYSPAPLLQLQGLSHLLMWGTRTTRLPLSIECTAELLWALHRPHDTAACSLAVIRFVNGHTDRAQTGLYAKSVSKLAGDIGIPDWVIDIRHDATHKTVPDITQLQLGVRHALAWLRDKYWQPQHSAFCQAEQNVRKYVESYTRTQSTIKRHVDAGKKISRKEISLQVEQVSSLSNYELWLFPDLFIQALEAHSYEPQFCRPLFLHLDKVRPSVLGHVVHLLTLRFQPGRISSLIGELLSLDLIKEADNKRFLISGILSKDTSKTSQDLVRKILNTFQDSLPLNLMKLKEFLEVVSTSVNQKTELCSDYDIVGELESVLNRLTRPLTSSMTSSRFTECNASDWVSVPLGCLPGTTATSLDLPSPHDLGTSQHDPVTSQHDPVTAQHDPVTSQHGFVTSQHDPVTSQHGLVTSQHDPVTSQHDLVTSHHDMDVEEGTPIESVKFVSKIIDLQSLARDVRILDEIEKLSE